MNYAKVGTLYDIGLERLGIEFLKQEVKMASKGLLLAGTPVQLACAIEESIAFLRGSGLDYAVEAYGLQIDPRRFREVFFTWAMHRQHHHLPSLSAITPAISSNGASPPSERRKA